VHAAAQLVAALPEGAVELGFLQGHGSAFVLQCRSFTCFYTAWRSRAAAQDRTAGRRVQRPVLDRVLRTQEWGRSASCVRPDKIWSDPFFGAAQNCSVLDLNIGE